VFAALLSSILVPVSAGAAAVHVALSLAAIVAIGIVVGLVESSMARLRFVRVPQLLVTATLLAGFAVVLSLR
jgi:formate hydrogenlyase subunit 4